ncbi:MAG TPA: 2-oxo acid dehydrogenase subunit E2 [Steroidobacteraceae bacterium]|nr:2-oxo acid dehydrogenase subunit E2 [Steroidobacteraceae bacterium]
MTVEVRAPSEQSEGTRSQIVRWLKSAGEAVVRDEPLIEVETDKVTVEIAAPASGVLREILKQEQEEIAPGELLGRIETRASDSIAASPVQANRAAAVGEDAGARGRDPGAHRAAPAVQASDSAAERRRADATGHMSPAVKRLLAERGLEPAAVRGTGQGGRITVDDVLEHVSTDRARAPAPGSPASGRLIPHSALRKRIAEHMVRSLLETAPHVTTVFEADFSAVLAHRVRHREAYARAGAPLTLTAYILAACVGAIRAVPEANARWMEEALEVLERIDIGVATALPDRGLIVPVVRNVQQLTLEEIARELARLVGLAREDRLTPEDVRGGTFTISNHGVSGSLLAAPIVINQPQSAILGVGKVEKRPVVIEQPGPERIIAQPRGFVTLTIDHRVMDGHRANRFLEVLVQALEHWPLA